MQKRERGCWINTGGYRCWSLDAPSCRVTLKGAKKSPLP